MKHTKICFFYMLVLEKQALWLWERVSQNYFIFISEYLVSWCKIRCSRIQTEEINFWQFLETVSKENRFSLVTLATVAKESFPPCKSNNFLFWFVWCIYEVLLWSTTSDIFTRKFSIVLVTMVTSPQNLPGYNKFLIFLNQVRQA